MENGKQDKNTKEGVKSRASMIVDGLIEPEPHEKYLLNLRKRKPFNEWDKEELRKVSQKGNKALQELHGEQKSARDALKNVLTLKITDDIVNIADVDGDIVKRLRKSNPNATLYDLIQAVAVGRALDGNVKAMEYVRDTHGDKPIDKVEITDNVMTDNDRALLRSISDRLEQADAVQIVKDITDTDVKTTDTDG